MSSIQAKQDILQQLNETVQHNCHIADATHAGDYTLCIYLLKMRELYRWENKASFSKTLGNQQVGLWLKKRENLWEKLENIPSKNRRIDVWWWGDASSRLMLLLAYLMTRSDDWKDSKIRVLAAGHDPESQKTVDSLLIVLI